MERRKKKVKKCRSCPKELGWYHRKFERYGMLQNKVPVLAFILTISLCWFMIIVTQPLTLSCLVYDHNSLLPSASIKEQGYMFTKWCLPWDFPGKNINFHKDREGLWYEPLGFLQTNIEHVNSWFLKELEDIRGQFFINHTYLSVNIKC